MWIDLGSKSLTRPRIFFVPSIVQFGPRHNVTGFDEKGPPLLAPDKLDKSHRVVLRPTRLCALRRLFFFTTGALLISEVISPESASIAVGAAVRWANENHIQLDNQTAHTVIITRRYLPACSMARDRTRSSRLCDE
jgi:hypothetical protein